MLTGLKFALSLGSNFLKTGVKSESFNVSGNLLFVKDWLIQFISSGKQNVLSFRISIGISPAETLSGGKFFRTFLTVASETYWKEIFLLSWTFSLILRILGWFENCVWFLEPYHHRH